MICRYSTGAGVNGGSALIHEFYAREVTNPIHLTVDTGFTNGEGTIKAFVSSNLSLGDRQLAAQFQEIPVDLRMVDAERVGCEYSNIFFIFNIEILLVTNSIFKLHTVLNCLSTSVSASLIQYLEIVSLMVVNEPTGIEDLRVVSIQ